MNNITELFWPWQSEVMIQYPWSLLTFFIILAIPLSVISWIREKK